MCVSGVVDMHFVFLVVMDSSVPFTLLCLMCRNLVAHLVVSFLVAVDGRDLRNATPRLCTTSVTPAAPRGQFTTFGRVKVHEEPHYDSD